MNPTLHSSARVTRTSSPLAQFGWAIADAWIITRRDLMHWRLRPGTVIMGWFFPVMIVLMFGLLFGGAIRVPNGGSYFEFLMPGMFATTMLFGLAATTIAGEGRRRRFRSLHRGYTYLHRRVGDHAGSWIASGMALACWDGPRTCR